MMGDRGVGAGPVATPRGGVLVDGLTKRIRGMEVLSGVSIEVPAGSVVGLSGANGSGKTMLMRAMLGLIRPTSGEVIVDGKVLWREISFPPSVGVLLEGPAFLPRRSGLENLALLASVRGTVTRERCTAALADVGLDPDDGRPYRKYSLGMKQRLGIAGAVVECPDLIVLDEPTNALDAPGIEMVRRVVRRERRRGATIVLACHDEAVLRELSDTIYFMVEGHVNGCEEMGTNYEG